MQPVLPSESNSINTRAVLDAAEDGRALSSAEALHLLELKREDDLSRLRETADTLRRQQRGSEAGYTTGCSLYLTNLDEVFPTIHHYSKKPGDNRAWTLTIDEIDATLERAASRNLQQIYVSGGGFWSYLQIPGLEAPGVLKTYAKVLGHIREKVPSLKISGFSPDEIDFLCVISERSERYILELLQDQGMQVLGGNGTEVLVDAVRQKISPKKALVKRWFEIATAAHALEIPIRLHLEAGHFETLQQRAQHLEKARSFLKTHPDAFTLFASSFWTGKPAPEQGGNGRMMPGAQYRTLQDRQKLSAVTRLYLGGILPVQQVCWQPDAVAASQETLQWGADFFGNTDALAEQAFLSGSRQPVEFTGDEFVRLIREAGSEPKRLD